MTTVSRDLWCLQPYGSYDLSETDAWEPDLACPYCGAPGLVRVAMTGTKGSPATRWLRCSSCLEGSLINDLAMVFPSPSPLREPDGLPETDRAIWNEARTCLGAGAYAATVMLCRKLLLHIAVSKGLPAKDAKDRAPSFADAADHLLSRGVITHDMKPWVDRIKDVGNEANHELEPVQAARAEDVAEFTLMLLTLAYELQSRFAKTDPEI